MSQLMNGTLHPRPIERDKLQKIKHREDYCILAEISDDEKYISSVELKEQINKQLDEAADEMIARGMKDAVRRKQEIEIIKNCVLNIIDDMPAFFDKMSFINDMYDIEVDRDNLHMLSNMARML